MKHPTKHKVSERQSADVMTREEAAVAAFSLAVDRFVSANTVSEGTARQSLVDMGIIDITGKLTKNYQ